MIDDEAAAALASIQYRDIHFKKRKLYTAWDNLRDEKVFFVGVERLQAAGAPPKHLRAYMLVGFDFEETWERIWHRFNRMVSPGIELYPMVYTTHGCVRSSNTGKLRSAIKKQFWNGPERP